MAQLHTDWQAAPCSESRCSTEPHPATYCHLTLGRKPPSWRSPPTSSHLKTLKWSSLPQGLTRCTLTNALRRQSCPHFADGGQEVRFRGVQASQSDRVIKRQSQDLIQVSLPGNVGWSHAARPLSLEGTRRRNCEVKPVAPGTESLAFSGPCLRVSSGASCSRRMLH